MKSPFRLDKRMALITSGSSGIGEATAHASLSAGWAVRRKWPISPSYLASDESGFMNGAALPIDGGWTAA